MLLVTSLHIICCGQGLVVSYYWSDTYKGWRSAAWHHLALVRGWWSSMNVLNCKNPFAALQRKRHLRYIVIHDVRSRHVTSRQCTTSRHVIHDIREASIQSITSRHVTSRHDVTSSVLLPQQGACKKLQAVTSRHVTTSAIPCMMRTPGRHVTSRQDVRRHHGRLQAPRPSRHVRTSGRHVTSGRQAPPERTMLGNRFLVSMYLVVTSFYVQQ